MGRLGRCLGRFLGVWVNHEIALRYYVVGLPVHYASDLRLTREWGWGLDLELAVIAASISIGGAAAKKRNQGK
jgi:hypothetical protein